ncbi:hypothetical protein COL8621_03699 [Actibacterium lipolyticum]|uniref:Uncharacterized protein n=1 Tax=Actibacterium lipolyticum TaxID=1524263 RepID=A0A238L850_9RHOB|nr:hypothetical protein COL8621_03699 [Actibacterium lipolyticum]
MKFAAVIGYFSMKSAAMGCAAGRTYARHSRIDDDDTLARTPFWVTSARVETPEDVAFLSGAALNRQPRPSKGGCAGWRQGGRLRMLEALPNGFRS